MKSIDIIVPCFNESECIEDSIFELTNFIKSENQYKFSIIFINDGSTDNTLKIISKYAKDYSYIKVINFTKNFGHQAAVSAGINHSLGDAAIIIDADLQDPISVASKMIDLWENGFDVVSGKRIKREGERLFKILSSKYFYRFLNFIAETNIPLDTGDFRLISKKVVIEFNKLVEQRKYIRGLISWMGFKSTFVSYDRVKRNKGTSKYNLQKSFNLALDGITSFSIRPLRIIGLIGFLISIISIFLILYIFFYKNISK